MMEERNFTWHEDVLRWDHMWSKWYSSLEEAVAPENPTTGASNRASWRHGKHPRRSEEKQARKEGKINHKKDKHRLKFTQNLTQTVLFQFYNEMSILENKMFKICLRFVNMNIAKN